jgi:hypothetical protein
MIHLAGGISYPQNSIEGIAMGEVLQAIANGEDAEAAASRVTKEIEEMLGAGSDTFDRGLYIRPIPRWSGGVVTYKWDDLKSTFRPEVRRAMNDWEAGSNRRVRFVEFNGNTWDWTLVVLGVTHVVNIKDKSDLDAPGKALPGSLPWGISFLHLRSDLLISNSGGQTVYTVALHELGHILGLQHEHQRADRDIYVEVTNNDINNMRLPEIIIYASYPCIEFRTTMVLFIPIIYPVIVIRTDACPQFEKTSAFDFNSIMMYPDLPIKPGYQNTTNGINRSGVWRTKYTIQLSDLDKAFIRQIY